ncbi:hypothetical protein G7Z17_g2252 [Cylindrodendrum hubeiense]|uniref:FAD dependent oxidoreductase domain-containing protein n=1 Tax=Cylindrodendrum hubeiense TaxID=595255 RepID=A0A9P5HJB8_9HYPO|nr:hypothetical protein G7Z17_g2252 [Cylindrodendrum hubeiense]
MDPHSLTQQFKDRLCLTAGLPSINPTSSAWQDPPAPIATAQSEVLPSVTDIAIIGSGITGTSVAHTILNNPQASGLRVTILEARNACSGATGRNGGHLISDTCGHFEHLVNALGIDETVKILRFSEANIADLKTLVAQLDDAERKAIELREVNATTTVTDANVLDGVRRSLKMMQDAVDKTSLKYNVVEDQNVLKNKYKYRSGLAVFEQEGAVALWPYRLITILQKRLLDAHKGRFTLETSTPVTSITHNEDASEYEPGYLLHTPRGIVSARKVIHCTNGYLSHLIPSLTGKLYPLRGTMSVQDPGSSFPKLGHLYSWTKMHAGSYDPETRCLTTGLYYAQQNANTGEIFIGGESQEVENLLTSNDSAVAASASRHISSIVPEIYLDADDAKTKKVWSGIMGFTADGLPMAGNLSRLSTGRTGSGEWIAAGFNGHGMDKCWLTGQAVAKMALGEAVPSWFPESFLISEERLKACTVDVAAAGIVGLFTGST